MNNQPVTIYGMLAFALLLLNAVILETALVKDQVWYKALWFSLPLLLLLLYKHWRQRGQMTTNNQPSKL